MKIASCLGSLHIGIIMLPLGVVQGCPFLKKIFKPSACDGSGESGSGQGARPGVDADADGALMALVGEARNPQRPEAFIGTAEKAMEAMKQDLLALIQDRPGLAAKFIRLSFHDCVGGCDGCVDLEHPENAGLAIPMHWVREVCETYRDQLSRADCWAIAYLASAEYLQPDSDYAVEYVLSRGRKDCELTTDETHDELDVRIGNGGDHQENPSPLMTTEEVKIFFDETFDFDWNDTVAILGAHSVGQMHRGFSGFQGRRDSTNFVLDNQYYQYLLDAFDNQYHQQESPANEILSWVREIAGTNAGGSTRNLKYGGQNGSKGTGGGQKQQVRAGKNGGRGGPIKGGYGSGLALLPVDMALVADLSDYIEEGDKTGQVSCTFGQTNTVGGSCPYADGFYDIVVQYADSQADFLNAFRAALTKLTKNGCDNLVDYDSSRK